MKDANQKTSQNRQSSSQHYQEIPIASPRQPAVSSRGRPIKQSTFLSPVHERRKINDSLDIAGSSATSSTSDHSDYGSVANSKCYHTGDMYDMAMSVGHDVDSVHSDISNDMSIERGHPPVQLAWQMNSCFIDSLIMCLMSSDPFRETVLRSFGKWDEILDNHAFYHLSLVMRDMEERRCGSDHNEPVIYSPSILEKLEYITQLNCQDTL
jgi:hypothetical protein